jgi:membrane fusion protein, macrolide-specific efflux system
LIGLTSVIGAISLVCGLKHSAFRKAEAQRSATAVAQIADIEDTVVATGTIQPFKMVSVGAQASGQIVALHVSLGEEVKKGQLIAEIDPSTERNALRIAEATLEQERAQRASRAVALRQAQLAFKRAATTYQQEASSQADYETAEATYEGSRADVAALDAQIRQAIVQVDTARVTLAYTKVVAPMDGTVVAIVAPEGQTVNAVQAAPTIVKLANLTVMTVKVQISEADVTRVHPSQKVYFTILGNPAHRYETKLRAVEPAPESTAADTTASSVSSSSASNSAVYYNGLFDIKNQSKELRISMTAQVNIIVAEAKHTLTIPSAALESVPKKGWIVVTISSPRGVQTQRRVQVGIDNHISTQILSGLAAGDRVLLKEAIE